MTNLDHHRRILIEESVIDPEVVEACGYCRVLYRGAPYSKSASAYHRGQNAELASSLVPSTGAIGPWALVASDG
jgi:hypothetical protein